MVRDRNGCGADKRMNRTGIPPVFIPAGYPEHSGDTSVILNRPILWRKIMTSAFNPKTGAWEIGWPGRISKHDVVYLTPP